MNVSSRYWSSIDENEFVFCVKEQQKVYLKIIPRARMGYLTIIRRSGGE